MVAGWLVENAESLPDARRDGKPNNGNLRK
jgi:hypothetical protein